MRHEQRFVWLDLIRGLAAVVVCAEHVRNVMLVDHAQLATSSLAQRLIYGITGLGHEAVMVFFVLSGFFVGGSLLRRPEFDARAYATARLSRLWVVLVPALLVTALVDAVTVRVAPEVVAGAHHAAWHSGPSPDAPYSASAATLAANLAFLQTVAAPVFGTNGPLWSLANEFWYYVLFPLGLLAAGGGGRHAAGSRILAAAVAVALLALLPPAVQAGLPVWLLGVAAHAAVGRMKPGTALAWRVAGGLLLALALANSKTGLVSAHVPVPADLLIGAAFAVLLAGLVNGTAPQPGTRLARVAVRLSDMSYSLYLVHFPVVMLIGASFYAVAKRPPTPLALAELAGWLAALLLLGHGFWWCFERHTATVRRWLDARLAPSRPA